jgi:hypothetical protein
MVMNGLCFASFMLVPFEFEICDSPGALRFTPGVAVLLRAHLSDRKEPMTSAHGYGVWNPRHSLLALAKLLVLKDKYIDMY